MSPDEMSPAEAESIYFSSHRAPRALATHEALARAFVDRHVQANRRLALVTSGGTTVPLENQTVRFIDNFSAGTRGATSAEYFLQQGYAVIFLHRQFSLLPYSRHYSHSTNCFLDFMDEVPAAAAGGGAASASAPSPGQIVVRAEYQDQMRDVLRKYRYAKENNLLLLLSFTTVSDYLFELRALAKIMKPLGANALFYLAAAVSDFFIPHDRMAEHKIQSSELPEAKSTAESAGADDGTGSNIYTGENESSPARSRKLVIDLDPVPKFLHRLVDGWAPDGSTIVSFKLETDPSILVYKARTALQRYSHHLVIGNLLSTRKWEVVFVTPDAPHERWIRVPKSKRSKSISGVENQVGLAEQQQQQQQQDEEQQQQQQQQQPPPPPPPPPQLCPTDEPRDGVEIESLIVPELVRLHSQMIALAQQKP